jgi:phenolic acid decarboxylase
MHKNIYFVWSKFFWTNMHFLVNRVICLLYLNRWGENNYNKGIGYLNQTIKLVSKWVSHFEIFDKSDIPKFSFHFFYNKKGFNIIECHVKGTTRHYMNNIKE